MPLFYNKLVEFEIYNLPYLPFFGRPMEVKLILALRAAQKKAGQKEAGKLKGEKWVNIFDLWSLTTAHGNQLKIKPHYELDRISPK